MQLALQGPGIDAKRFTGHSFRIGAATFTAQVGIQDSTIKMLGRWELSAYLQYIQMPRESLAAISTQLTDSTQDLHECVCLFLGD